MEKSSESESDLPFWDQKVKYCYTNGFLFHFGDVFVFKGLLLKNKNLKLKKVLT